MIIISTYVALIVFSCFYKSSIIIAKHVSQSNLYMYNKKPMHQNSLRMHHTVFIQFTLLEVVCRTPCWQSYTCGGQFPTGSCQGLHVGCMRVCRMCGVYSVMVYGVWMCRYLELVG